MHFKLSSAICFNMDLSKILSSGNGLKGNNSIKNSMNHDQNTIHTFLLYNETIYEVRNKIGSVVPEIYADKKATYQRRDGQTDRQADSYISP